MVPWWISCKITTTSSVRIFNYFLEVDLECQEFVIPLYAMDFPAFFSLLWIFLQFKYHFRSNMLLLINGHCTLAQTHYEIEGQSLPSMWWVLDIHPELVKEKKMQIYHGDSWVMHGDFLSPTCFKVDATLNYLIRRKACRIQAPESQTWQLWTWVSKRWVWSVRYSIKNRSSTTIIPSKSYEGNQG